MAKLHKKKEIENYEELWQRRYYMQSGDGIHYIHVCEICHNTNGVRRILGGHYICHLCKKKLRLPKKKTIIKWGKAGQEFAKRFVKYPTHPSDPAKEERIEVWKKIIKLDYMIDLFNKNFEYEH